MREINVYDGQDGASLHSRVIWEAEAGRAQVQGQPRLYKLDPVQNTKGWGCKF
jgi:hypothetical protein